MRLVGVVALALLASTFAVRMLNWTAKKFEKVISQLARGSSLQTCSQACRDDRRA